MNKKYFLLVLGAMLIGGPAFAQETLAVGTSENNAVLGVFESGLGFFAIAAGLGLGLAALGGALGQAKAASAALEGIARNPGASQSMFTPFILSLVFIETLVLFTFVVAFLIVGHLGTSVTELLALLK